MTQKIFTPLINKCYCGANAKIIDWDFRNMYKVYCDNNHTLTKECGTINRAIHRWNNRVEKVKEKLKDLSILW